MEDLLIGSIPLDPAAPTRDHDRLPDHMMPLYAAGPDTHTWVLGKGWQAITANRFLVDCCLAHYFDVDGVLAQHPNSGSITRVITVEKKGLYGVITTG
jgi:hypothetical protein